MTGPLPLTFSRAYAPVDGGTQVTFRYDAEPIVGLKPLAPLAIRAGKRQLDGDIPRLRAILETRSSSTRTRPRDSWATNKARHRVGV